MGSSIHSDTLLQYSLRSSHDSSSLSIWPEPYGYKASKADCAHMHESLCTGATREHKISAIESCSTLHCQDCALKEDGIRGQEREREQDSSEKCMQKFVHSECLSAACTRIPIRPLSKTFCQSGPSRKRPSVMQLHLQAISCLSHLGTSLSQCIHKHIHTGHVLSIKLALANNICRQELDCLIQGRLVVSDLGADDTDGLLADTCIFV